MQSPITLDTIGDLADDGYQLALYCDACGLGQGWADLAALIVQLGREYSCDRAALQAVLACPDCLRPLDFRLHPPPDCGAAGHYTHSQ